MIDIEELLTTVEPAALRTTRAYKDFLDAKTAKKTAEADALELILAALAEVGALSAICNITTKGLRFAITPRIYLTAEGDFETQEGAEVPFEVVLTKVKFHFLLGIIHSEMLRKCETRAHATKNYRQEAENFEALITHLERLQPENFK